MKLTVKRTLVWWCTIVPLLAFSGALRAQSAQAVTEAYFAALQSEGILSTTQFMHPVALTEFQSMVMPVYAAELASGGNQLLEATFPGKTYEAVEKLDAKVFMDGFMRLVIAQTGDVPVQFDKLEVLGTVEEGPARHVLARMTVEAAEISITEVEVLSFIPFEDTWRLQLNSQMKGIAAALRSRMPPPATGQ